MINPFVFTFQGPILPGQYLLGSPKWTRAMALLTARIVCQAGASTDPTVFQLEVDGVLVAKTIRVMPRFAGDIINLPLRLNYILPANSWLRIKCVSGPADPADAVRAIGLNLEADESSSVTPSTPEMWVRYVEKGEKIRLFEYDPSTHLFTESTVGLASTRATLDNATTFAATIKSTTAAHVVGDQFKVNEVICNGGVATNNNPRLEFYIGTKRVASLSQSGLLFVMDVTESATVTGGTDRFEFYGSGVVVATIGPIVDSGATILTAIELCEPTT